MTMPTDKDGSLDTLLDLDGEIFPMDNGYWVKFEVRIVPATKAAPHGIKYSLTLHDRNNTRVLGFDDAHTVSPKIRKALPGVRSRGITRTI